MSGSADNQNAIIRAMQHGEQSSNRGLQDATGLSQRQVMRAAGSLVSKGLLARVEQGVFQLTPKGAEAKRDGTLITSGPNGPFVENSKAPVRDTHRQAAWSAMRVFGVFSTADLASVVTDAPTDQDQQNIRRYCRALRDAGFLVDMPTR